MKNKRTIGSAVKNSKYFELSGLLCLILIYSIFVQAKSGTFLTIPNINNILWDSLLCAGFSFDQWNV